MDTTALVLIVIFAATLGAAITLISLTFFKRDEPADTDRADSSTDDFVKNFTEVLTCHAMKIEAEFIQRLTAKAEETLSTKDEIKEAGYSNQSGENPNYSAP